MTTRVRLHVLRHGEPAPPGIFYGHRDVELSSRGQQQVEAQRAALAHVELERVWTSDLSRAEIGARAIAGTASVTVCSALREMNLGVLEGAPMAEARERFPELASLSFYDMLDVRFRGGGESVRDVAARVLPVLEAGIRDVARPAATTDVALYAHNTVNRVVLSAACGLGPEGYIRFAQDYGCRSRIDFEFERMRGGSVWTGAAIAYANLPP